MESENLNYEPMDIDLSSNSEQKMDISGSEIFDNSNIHEMIACENITTTQQVKTNIKTYHIKIETKKKVIGNRCCPKATFIWSTLLIISIAVAFHYVISSRCIEEMDLVNIKRNLYENVYGQSRAIDSIIKALSMNVSSKILFLYGGTGVGKTYTTSLILERSWQFVNIYHYTMPSFASTFSSDFMLGLSICKSSVYVIDDLTGNDIGLIKTHISDIIAKSESLSKNVTIILIINCDITKQNFVKKCDQSFYKSIKDNFEDIKAVKEFIQFDPLTEEHLKKCIYKELRNKNVQNYVINNILKNFNVSLDGCKNVYTKINFMNM